MGLESGTKIARWTVLSEIKLGRKRYYKCRCECGTERNVQASALENGRTKSCGCLRTDLVKARAEDLTGKRFGRLVVLHKDEGRSGFWVCQCDCGKITSVIAKSLRKKEGGTQSCGCIQREFATKQGAKSIQSNSKERVELSAAYNTNVQILKSGLFKNNVSGHKGVWWDEKRQKWEAFIQIHGKRKHLGRYNKYEDAVKARQRAEEEYFEPILKEIGLK